MSQLIVEVYNYKDSWRQTAPQERRRFVEGVMQSMSALPESGVEILGCAHNDVATDRRAPYDFFCVYRADDQQAQKMFFEQIERSGWYDRFDQINLSGAALNAPGVLFDNAALITPGLQGTPIGSEMPFSKQYTTIKGRRMARVDIGEGDTIVFLHGDVTSSYLWRNVIPHVQTLGRCVAIDLIGAGDSDKLADSGPGSYGFAEHASYLEPMLDSLDLGDRIVLVGHDWGCNLGFEWAMKNPGRVAGLAFSEPLQPPFTWADWPAYIRPTFELIRSNEGEKAILEQNLFVTESAQRGNLRMLSDEEQAQWVRPYKEVGEARRPTLTWPREVPFEDEQTPTRARIEAHAAWLNESQIPKLYIRGEPGAMLFGKRDEGVRRFPALTELSAKGLHWPPEDDPHTIGEGLANWVAQIRG